MKTSVALLLMAVSSVVLALAVAEDVENPSLEKPEQDRTSEDVEDSFLELPEQDNADDMKTLDSSFVGQLEQEKASKVEMDSFLENKRVGREKRQAKYRSNPRPSSGVQYIYNNADKSSSSSGSLASSRTGILA